MLKIPTDLTCHKLNGPTMGTRWSAQFYAPAVTDPDPIHAALVESVDVVDRQMSTWKADSDLMRINRATVGTLVPVPAELMEVLTRALEIGRLSSGAFDIGVGDVVAAWGFGPHEANESAMRAALGHARPMAHEILDLDRESLHVRKQTPITLDLSGIAKGYAVDRMMAALSHFGITDALVGLDGEIRARGQRPDGKPWTIALERPDFEARAALSILELKDCAVATSGDYRHWVDVGGKRLSHTMDPARGGPVMGSPASVTVLAENCMDADAWATAFMILGSRNGKNLAQRLGLSAIFIDRDGETLRESRVGWVDRQKPSAESSSIDTTGILGRALDNETQTS
ncbi:FAD:protein FMN transferase [Sneathiella sp. HT1-7]|uniref:FAD:protein FMN transferase n=1 Tax=Sneathiella sp. HT1-7 TaxID=2887192 RepID=UPI001D156D70|nr:FAD:protein FMN transferase [Sneathiella sp. HT1-7]MCC3305092.1 FAD:protein FMN transferase [Sneathiella sp. HT1-7]